MRGFAKPSRAEPSRDGLDARHERRGEARAADAVLAVVVAGRPEHAREREVLRLADEHAGRRIGVHRDVRNGAARRVRRDDAVLVPRAAEDLAVAAARAAVERARARPRLAVLRERVERGAPAGLPEARVVLVDRDRRAADRGHPGVTGRVVGVLDAPGLEVVAVVAGGEVEADALDGALLEDRLVGLDEVLRRSCCRRRRRSRGTSDRPTSW